MRRSKRKSRTTLVSVLTTILAAVLLLLAEQFGLLPDTDPPGQALSGEEAQLVQSFETADLSVCVFSVGQADAVVVRQADEVMLIDCAESDNAPTILANLEKLGIDRIDTLVLTHPHADHIGGAQKVIEGIPVERIYMPAASTSTVTFDRLMDCILENKIDTREAYAGMEIPFGDCSLRVLSPEKHYSTDNLNAYSIVLFLEYDGIKMLFSGDAERENEDMILASGENIDCDFVKIGHHGSNTSSTKDFISACSADWAVATTEYDSPHGLPKDKVLARWEDAGANVLCTHLCGDVYAFVRSGRLEVYTSQEPASQN